MSDWRKYYDAEYIGSWDLEEGDVTVTVSRVTQGELKGNREKAEKKPVIEFSDAKKKMALNKTNGKIIASLYGNDCSKWTGKKITLYRTTCDAFGATVECVRVRPQEPAAKLKAAK